MNKKIIVAMSGGVDSSVTALLLKNKGYDVRGVFLDFFGNKKSVSEVKKVSKKIGIPIEAIDSSKDFKRKVIDYFLKELKDGNTPNPCVVCNKEIKFRILIEKMLALKADYVATGHYARIIEYTTCNKKNQFGLAEAKDNSKDQSYFLYRLGQEELSKILFPLGGYTKVEVRKMAKKFGLHVHDKEESQDVCFIPEKGYENFLRKMLRLKQGKITDISGKILGVHEGLPLYTLGQRKGIKLGGDGPYYVIRKDIEKNRLVVSNKKENAKLFNKKIKLEKINWTAGKPKFPFKALVRTRYRSPLVYATITKDTVAFESPQKAITPGQSAVFYSKKGEVLGGGTIG